MTGIREITTALRTLDPASGQADPCSPRARSDLRRILATDPSPDPGQQRGSPLSGRTSRRRNTTRTARRVALAGGVLAVTASVVALPAITGGDQAFASWTHVPHGLSASERADAAASCRQSQQDGPKDQSVDQLRGAQPAIAERRGTWTTVVLAGTGGFSAMCITDDSSHLFAKDMIGSLGTTADGLPLGRRDLIATDLGTGTMSAGDLSLAAGAAGPDVVAIVYHSRTHGDVDATVSDGHFALWFPGDELKHASSSNPVEVEVTYRDGSTNNRQLRL